MAPPRHGARSGYLNLPCREECCTEANRVYLRQQRQNRREWLAAYKLEKGCADCGYNAHSEALDFDHVEDNKEFGLGGRGGQSWERIYAEVEKCEVVCANCHRVRTRQKFHDPRRAEPSLI